MTVDDPAFEAFANSLAAALTEGIGDGPESTTVAPDGSLTVVNVPISGGDFPSDTAIGAVERLRNDVIPAAFTGVPARALVGGGATPRSRRMRTIWGSDSRWPF